MKDKSCTHIPITAAVKLAVPAVLFMTGFLAAIGYVGGNLRPVGPPNQRPVPPQPPATFPLSDGFENVDVGDYPDENGWEVIFRGDGAAVSDTVANSGKKSFRVRGRRRRAGEHVVSVGEVPDQMTYQASVYIAKSDEQRGIVGFVMKADANHSVDWNCFFVSTMGGENRILFSGAGESPTEIGPYTPGTWTTLRADLDYVNLKADLWVDGILKVAGAPIKPRKWVDKNWGQITTSKWGVTVSSADAEVYFDDVMLITEPNTLGHGLVALWMADGNASDSAGTNHGTLKNGVGFAHGKFGKAFKLDGKDDYIDFGNPKDLQITGSQTIAMWIFPDRLGRRQNPIAKAYGGEGTITLIRDGQLTYYCGFAGGNAEPYLFLRTGGESGTRGFKLQQPDTMNPHPATAQVRLKPKQWAHITVVRNLKAKRLTWYINGALIVAAELVGPDQATVSPLPLCVGKGYVNNFSGLIDEVAIWKRALEPEEVRAVFQAQSLSNLGPVWFGGELPQINRIETADQVLLKNNDVLRGTITKAVYTVTTCLGKFEIPAADVVGFVSDEKSQRIRLVLTDGQVLVGTLAEATLSAKLDIGPTMQLPVERIRQCAYRISKDKPTVFGRPGAVVMLLNGDRLNWFNPALRLELQTPYGSVKLPINSLRSIQFNQQQAGNYQVRLRNGSLLSGTLLPEKMALRPRLRPQLTIDTNTIRRLSWPVGSTEPSGGAVAVMRNGDRLLGQTTDEKLIIRTTFGEVAIHLGRALSMEFEAGKPHTVTARMWEGSILRGQLLKPALGFAIVPDGPTLELPLAQIASIVRVTALPPAEVVKKIEELIKQLGSDKHIEREEAGRELIRIGPPAIPILERHLEHLDPKIRKQLRPILETIGSVRIQFKEPEVLDRFVTPTPQAWRVANGKLIGRGIGPGEKPFLTYKTYFRQISKVVIKGSILPAAGKQMIFKGRRDVAGMNEPPRSTNFRVGVGRINLIFNWEVRDENLYRNGEAITVQKGHALTPAKDHTIVVEQVGKDVVVRVDKTEVYTTKANLDGTVTVYPAHGSTITVSEIYITGVPEPGREVRGHSHASTF